MTVEPGLVTGAAAAPGGAAPYANSLEMITDALSCLDAYLSRRLGRSADSGEPELKGFVVTDAEVRRLLCDGPAGELSGDPITGIGGKLWTRIEPRLAASREQLRVLPVEIVRERFGLSVFETEALLVCLAPDLNARYERLFGYMNDDLTRKYPSVHLLVELLAPEGEAPLRCARWLRQESRLLRSGLLAWVEDGNHSGQGSSLSRCLRVESDVVRFLLEEEAVDPELERTWHLASYPGGAPELWESLDARKRIQAALDDYLENRHGREPVILTLAGRSGSGRRYLAERACAQRGMGLIPLDCRRLVRHPQPEAVLLRAFRDSILHTSPVLLANAEAVVEDRERCTELMTAIERLVAERGWLLWLTVERPGAFRKWFSERRRIEIEFPDPSYGERARWWRSALAGLPASGPLEIDPLAEALASKFRLTPGELSRAFHQAVLSWRPGDPEPDWWSAVHTAASGISAPSLGELAQRIQPMYRWSQLVLPERKTDLLCDVVRHVQHRRKVMEEWAFDRVMNRGKGLNVLFSGPPGTGKTMAAEVIANELSMDLYRIDLSSVVSKYIGETEKNLARIFQEAERSDMLLFFDEADALFGKRSEVRDAHDRYANIEINYLLQQMENYRGVAILATNLRQNLDEAFLRRIHISVEFPMPGPEDRLRIWRNVFPSEAPRDLDVDLEFLAQTFDLSGGSIANIGLASAFLAADEQGPIRMGHLVCATQRELEKTGKRSVKEQFGAYFHLLAGGTQPAGASQEHRHGMPN